MNCIQKKAVATKQHAPDPAAGILNDFISYYYNQRSRRKQIGCSCKILRSIHVFDLLKSMCPALWGHVKRDRLLGKRRKALSRLLPRRDPDAKKESSPRGGVLPVNRTRKKIMDLRFA
jgi:hypothetical protein